MHSIRRLAFIAWNNRSMPLAWLLLKRQPIKTGIAIIGIIFASILILMQLGFRDALFESSVALIRQFNSDLVLINKLSVSSTGLIGFDEQRLARLEAQEQVEEVIPVRWDYVMWRYRSGSEKRLAIMMGIDPNIITIDKPEILSQQHKLKIPNRILFDRLSRNEFGPVVEDFQASRDGIAFINEKRVRVAGLIEVGNSFGYDAFVLTSLNTFESISDNLKGKIEIGFIRLKPGLDPGVAAEQIRSSIGDDLKILTLKEFEEFERKYWDTSKPIGFVFAFGAVMGLLVGLVVVYQILYSDVSSHIDEYATMLSMGYDQRALRMIVANESFFLSSIGYPLALFISMGLYALVRAATNIRIFMTFDRAIGTFMLVYAMCFGSALLAMLRLRDADPTDVLT